MNNAFALAAQFNLSLAVKTFKTNDKCHTVHVIVTSVLTGRSTDMYVESEKETVDEAQLDAFHHVIMLHENLQKVSKSATPKPTKEVATQEEEVTETESTPSKTTKKTTKKKSTVKKPKTIAYDRGQEVHKDILSNLFTEIAPKWDEDEGDLIDACIKISKESLVGKPFLDEKGELLEATREAVTKVLAPLVSAPEKKKRSL